MSHPHKIMSASPQSYYIPIIGLAVLPGIFLGLYSASLIHCVRWLLFEDEGWRIRKKFNWWLVTTAVLVFFFSTIWFCAMSMTTFSIYELNTFRTSISNAYSRALTILNSSAIEWSALILIDSVMIYRCWIVFSKNRFIMCFPIALWCFGLICEILSFYCDVEESFVTDRSWTALEMCFGSHYIDWTPMAFYMCNIMINIYTTSALVYKIWRAAAKYNNSTNRLYRICRILTESGILYTLSSLIYLSSWLQYYSVSGSVPYVDPESMMSTGPLGFQIVQGLFMFMPGIAFNLVIIRIGEQRATGEDTWVDSMGASNAIMPSQLPNHADMSTQGEMGYNSHGRMDGGEVMEIRERDGEVMEVDRTRELEGQS